MRDLGPLVNKTVEFAFSGARLRFDLSHALFSSFDIDQGTRLLLKTAAGDPCLPKARRILDAGCGVGVIGLCMAKAFPGASVTLRDRDLLAVAFTERNRALNGIPQERALAEPGLLPIGRDRSTLGGTPERERFDVVLSNLPAKAGSDILGAFVAEAGRGLLEPGGTLAFVIVRTLAEEARRWCAGPGFSSFTEAESKGHSVFVCRTPASPERVASQDSGACTDPGAGTDSGAAFLDPYVRSEHEHEIGGRPVMARGYRGLPEFDTPGFGTEVAVSAAIKAARGCLIRRMLVVEPGIGLSALWAGGALGPDRATLASRDLLQLGASRRNLAGSGLFRGGIETVSSLELDALPDASFDLQIWSADETPMHDWPSEAWADISRLATKGAAFVMACTAQGASRFSKRVPRGMRILGEKRKKGFTAVYGRREA